MNSYKTANIGWSFIETAWSRQKKDKEINTNWTTELDEKLFGLRPSSPYNQTTPPPFQNIALQNEV